MRNIVYIDGENLSYAIREASDAAGFGYDRECLKGYDYRGLIADVLGDMNIEAIYWFGARLKVRSDGLAMAEKRNRFNRYQTSLINNLGKQGIDFIKVGYLRAREGDPCSRCNFAEMRFTEKGVDIGMAVKMIEDADNTLNAIVISADTDLMPALDAIKRRGATITYLSYENRPIVSIYKRASVTHTITNNAFVKYLKKDNQT